MIPLVFSSLPFLLVDRTHIYEKESNALHVLNIIIGPYILIYKLSK